MRTNIDILKKFLTEEIKGTIIINQVNLEIGCFYEHVLNEFTKKLDINLIRDLDSENLNQSKSLFENSICYLYFSTNSKKIDKITNNNSKNIIITDYKNFKKYIGKFDTINGYEFDKDLKFYINNYLNINNENLIHYCISHPYLTFSEISKYQVNELDYHINSPLNNFDNIILETRKKIYKLKKSNLNVRGLYNLLKDEVKHKKFSFLTF